MYVGRHKYNVLKLMSNIIFQVSILIHTFANLSKYIFIINDIL